jgi:hypothetical protein
VIQIVFVDLELESHPNCRYDYIEVSNPSIHTCKYESVGTFHSAKQNSQRVAKVGDIYMLQIVAWPWNIHTSATQPALIAKTRVVTG